MKKLLITLLVVLFATLFTAVNAEVKDFGDIQAEFSGDNVTFYLPITDGILFSRNIFIDGKEVETGKCSYNQIPNVKDVQPIAEIWESAKYPISVTTNLAEKRFEFTVPIKTILNERWGIVFHAEDGNYYRFSRKYGPDEYGWILQNKNGEYIIKTGLPQTKKK